MSKDEELKPKFKNKRATRFDHVEALRLRDLGKSYEEIAEILSPEDGPPIHWTTIRSAAINKGAGIAGQGRSPERQRAKILLEEKHIAALQEITVEKLRKSSAKDNALIAKLLHEQLRLENNESTANNLSFLSIVEDSMKDGKL